MKLAELTNNATRVFHRVGFKIKKHSPEILVATGVIGTVASAVMACKATTKIDFVLEETKRKIDVVHEGVKNGEVQGYLENGDVGMVPYSEEDGKKDIAYVYGKTALKFAKLYGPSIALGSVSIASILAGHNMLRKRNLALAAAYQVVDTGFKQYRNNVIERFGEKMDNELKYNIKAKEIEETTTDKKGKEKTVKKTVEVADATAVTMSPYTFCFDETSNCWVRDAESNKFFLARQQEYANEKLRSKGYLFLNEVLDMLGIPRCRAGQAVGWMYDETNPIGDNYIDFGILDIRCEANRNFMNGLEKSIWLNFNVDGDILNNF